MFALIPINSRNCSDQAFMDIINKYGNPEVAIRLNDSNLSLRTIEDILICKEKTQYMLQKNNEALLQYVDEIKNLRNIILNDISTETAG